MKKLLGLLCRIYADESALQALRAGNREPATFADLWFVFTSHFRGLILHNPFGLAAGIAFFATIFKPWWYAAINMDYYFIHVFPFGLRHDLPSDQLDYVIETPLILALFLLWLLAGILFLAFWGSTLPGKKGRLFLLADGCFMLLYTAGFYGALRFSTHRVNLPVTGYTSVPATVEVDIHMHFLTPYHIAIAAGIACLLAVALHGLVKLRLTRG